MQIARAVFFLRNRLFEFVFTRRKALCSELCRGGFSARHLKQQSRGLSMRHRWMEVRSFASLNAVLDDLALHSVLVSSLVSRQEDCSGWRTPASWVPWGFDKQVAPPSDFQWSQYVNKEILPISEWWWAVGQVRTGPRSGFTNRPEHSILFSLCLMVLKCQCFMLTLVSSGFPLAPARPSPFSLSFSVTHTEVGDQ